VILAPIAAFRACDEYLVEVGLEVVGGGVISASTDVSADLVEALERRERALYVRPADVRILRQGGD
jgi:hypothetical protein